MRPGTIRPSASGRIVLAGAGVQAAIILLAGIALVLGLRVGLASATETLVDDVTTNIISTAGGSGMAAAVDGAARASTTSIEVCARDTTGRTVSSASDGQCAWPPGVPQSLPPDEQRVSPGGTGMLDWNLTETIWQVRGTELDGNQWTIAVRADMGEDIRLLSLAKRLLLVGGVATWALGTVVLWLVVRRSLRPVAAIRATVDRIRAGSDLAERVPVPAGSDEIALLATTMNDMLARLSQADTEQRRFLSDASHELRTPVAVLRTGLEVEAETDEALPAGSRQAIRELASQAAGLAELIQSLLTFTRLDDPHAAVVSKEIDLDDLVDGEVRDLRLVSSHPIQLVIEPARLHADPTLIGQVVRNLVSNADRFARTSIRIRVTSRDSECLLLVDNDGPVIPPDDRERVFGRFVQLDDARTGGGAGLGLAICHRICEIHGGGVRVTEAPDGWCRFAVTLPSGGAVE
ncbi:hypothetical protein GCM10009785_02260 [Brooklawnia cerclae]|uniref:histidine kinase n=1 Tax=Brooklawnia cerclae TaxID=349934 RepID=A0ABX0SCR8_9ACTN|nr:HAMP domain-containing sensor histidine kinase [Brooklawnia cerclae]NIH56180.1 signal transduction histidine kinase [Brooklawnia cerclae]